MCHRVWYGQGSRPQWRQRKLAKYSSFSSSHVFVPVAVETLGPLADEAQLFLAEIGRRAVLCTADLREATFLYQWISVAI